MNRGWEREAEDLVFSNRTPRQAVATLMKKELRSLLPWVVGGLLFSFPLTLAAGYIVSFVAEDYTQAYFLGFFPALLGLGILGSQVILLHEGIHHSVYKPAEWVPRTIKWLLAIAFAFAAYLLLFFLPVQNILQIWNHHIVKVVDTLLLAFLGITSPYVAKVSYDYFLITPEKEQKLWKVSLILIAAYYLIGGLLLIFFLPQLSATDIGLRVFLLIASLISVIYTVKWNIRNIRRSESQVGELDNNSVKIKPIFRTIRENHYVTFGAATLVGMWLPIIGGVAMFARNGLTPPPMGVEPGVFIFGYAYLLFYGWIFIFGPILLSVLISVLALTASAIVDY